VVIYGAYPYGLYAGGPRPFWGSVLGGVAGGILGSAVGNGVGRAAAILGGAVIGSMVGGSVGQYMDDVDHLYVARALEYAPSGRVTAWRNPDTLTRYEVAPVRTFQTTDGRYCREYQTRALVGGAWQQLYGTACRQPDGNWALAR
jgi:surface antigen